LNTGLGEAEIDGIPWNPLRVAISEKLAFLDSRNDSAFADQNGGGIVLERRDTQNVHLVKRPGEYTSEKFFAVPQIRST
jgi:hypothetical protein